MRYLIILCLLISFACDNSARQKAGQRSAQKTDYFDYFQNDTIESLLEGIVRTDSNMTGCYLTFRSFDKYDSLVTELKYYQCQNNAKDLYLTRTVYDRQRKMILREIFNMEGSLIGRENH